MRKKRPPFVIQYRAPLILLCFSLLLYLLPASLAYPVKGRIVSASANMAALFAPQPEEPQERPPVEQLRRELAQTRSSLAAARNELHLLRKELENVTTVKASSPVELDKIIPARVVVRRDASNFRRTILVNRGTLAGVRAGMPVLWVSRAGIRPEGGALNACVVGRVGAAGPNAARILLASDPGFRVPSRMLRNRERVIVEGGCAGHWPMRIKHAGPNLDVQTGDAVVTSGSLGIFPPGLLVGTVAKVKDTLYVGKMEVCIDSPVNLDELESVIIVELTAPGGMEPGANGQ